MEHRAESWSELLERLSPLLAGLFATFDVSPQEAQEMVEESFLLLMAKRPVRQDPEGWIVRRIVDRCRKLSAKVGQKEA